MHEDCLCDTDEHHSHRQAPHHSPWEEGGTRQRGERSREERQRDRGREAGRGAPLRARIVCSFASRLISQNKPTLHAPLLAFHGREGAFLRSWSRPAPGVEPQGTHSALLSRSSLPRSCPKGPQLRERPSSCRQGGGGRMREVRTRCLFAKGGVGCWHLLLGSKRHELGVLVAWSRSRPPAPAPRI